MDPWLDDAHALIVGIGDYLHMPPLARSIARGARELAAVLADPDAAGYPPHQVRSLIDREATGDAIREELRHLAARTGTDSTTLLYFAGHGGRLATGGDDAAAELATTALLPVDADPAALDATSIGGAEVAAALDALSGHVLVIFDCCHAGGLNRRSMTPRELARGIPESFYGQLGAPRGLAILAAAREGERSWLPPDGGLSCFTGHLLAALKSGAGSNEATITALDLFRYIQRRLAAEDAEQHPVLTAAMEELFPVALCLGGVGAPDSTVDQPWDAYISFARREPDCSWVWDQLVPRLEEAGLAIAVSDDVEAPGVARVAAVEEGIRRSRRTVVVLSDAYLEDRMTGFIDTLAQTVGLDEGLARLLPVTFEDFAAERLPIRLRMLVCLELSHPARAVRNYNRLIKALADPPPAG